MLLRHVLLLCGLQTLNNVITVQSVREFTIDYENDQFLLDGAPFRYVSGSLHYFRVPAIYWQDRLHKIRMAGLNAVSTYVEWRSHEKKPGVFDFSGELDLERFISLAAEEGLLVLLRPGPYICAERDMGGLPSWLLKENPNMELRTIDPTYMAYVRRFFTVLMTRVSHLTYGNGGPIIMVQVENEYGSYTACDFNYTNAVKEILHSHIGNTALLYTTDGNSASYLKCGKVNGAYATVDFGNGANVTSSFEAMRKYEPRGPLVNSEYYTGWLDHWGEPHQTVNTASVVATLEEILDTGASLNFYMFFGGTNFGFTSGANFGDSFTPQLTSYDYDAPLTEAGDPTDKYIAIRETLKKYLPLPPGPLPTPSKKGAYGRVTLDHVISLFDMMENQIPVSSRFPLSFEELDQWSGYVLYETTVTKCIPDPSLLNATGMHDRAYVYVNRIHVGTLSRMQSIYTMPIFALPGDKLQILVENQGRVNYGRYLRDLKGLLNNVTLAGDILENWSIYQFTLYEFPSEAVEELKNKRNSRKSLISAKQWSTPAVFQGQFMLPANITQSPPPDTYLNLKGWYKGVAFMNGVNLGRYWSVAGPQQTLYVPGSFLRVAPAINSLVLVELEGTPAMCKPDVGASCAVHLQDTAILNNKC